MSGCEKCDESEAAGKQRIATKAAVLCAALPDEFACQALPDQKIGRVLSATRNLMAECSLAGGWNKNDFESRRGAFDFAELALEFAAESIAQTTKGCREEKQVCIEICDGDEDAGYTCYLDCRIEYYSCLATVIIHGSTNRE